MDTSPFQLQRFRLESQADVSHMGRRIRLLAALTELPQKQREDISKAVSTYCRRLLEADLCADIDFQLVCERNQPFLQIVITDDGSAGAAVPHPAAAFEAHRQSSPADSTTWRRLQNALDEFSSTAPPGEGGSAVMRQMLPPTFEFPSAEEADLWRRMLDQRTLEDAIVLASRRSRRIEADADRLRKRDELRDEVLNGNEQSETWFSLIASETDNFVVVMDAQGCISWVNRAFVRMTGYSAHEINRRRLDELLGGPNSSPETMRRFREALDHGHSFNDEVLLYRRDGRTYWTHFTLTPVRSEQSELRHWIAIGTDVTQQHQAVEALAASRDAAESANRAKSDFLANMSHEIRTPLNAIIGMTDLSLGTDLTREQRDYLQTVQSSAQALLELLNDILDLSKIEAGKMVIESADFNLADLLRDTVQALAVKAHAKGIELACRIPPQIPGWVRGDATRLRQILVNLVGNSIKFTHHGEVVVDVEQQWRNSDHIGLHFCVRDTGIGISQESLEKIFESFQQADTSTTREFGGTGLGLTITSELLQLMGGRIWVESVQGEGSQFHFSLTFPVVPDPPDVPSASAENLRGLSVLIVDDNQTNRTILAEVTSSWGMHPAAVSSGSQAIQAVTRQTAADQPFDLVLLDAMMPGMDGFQVAEALQQRADLRCGTVMMLSSADQPDGRRRCQQLGIAQYVVKPVLPSELLTAVLTAISSQTAVEPLRDTSARSSETAASPLRILVADDHEANRRLAVTVLRKRGHECEEAVNGVEAAAKCRESDPPFDVVLMDVQMPELDGFGALSQIRKDDADMKRDTVVIALTAHAMKGDREHCLAQGMDGYLAKPIQPHQLVETCERQIASASAEQKLERSNEPCGQPNSPACDQSLNSSAPAASPADGAAVTAHRQPVDFDFALQRLDGEQELLRMQMQYFLDDGPELVSRIRAGIRDRRPPQVRQAAHRLKGLLAGYGRRESTAQAAKLEQLACAGALNGADRICDQLADDVHAVVDGIRGYL